jgi:hypothetical protein
MRKTKTGERGQAIVEVTLMAPWIFFLFIGITDLGFYAYAAICTQNAARAAAVRTAADGFSQTQPLACTAALNELYWLPNMRVLLPNEQALTSATCVSKGASITPTNPVAVAQSTLCAQGTVKPATIVCTAPGCADCGADTAAASSLITVTYQSGLMVPIPGILTNQLHLTRTAEMRIILQ